MENNFFKQISTILAILLVALLSGTTLVLKHYFNYKSKQPITSLPTGGIDVPDGLVAHFKFDTVTNNTTPNSSIHSNDGQFRSFAMNASRYVYGSPELVEGPKGNALEFNGKHWVSAGNENCFNTGKFTLAIWAWLDNDEKIDVPTIMAKSDWPKYNGWWLCTTTIASGADRNGDVDLAISMGNDFKHIKSGYQLPPKEWHHIVVTMDNTLHEVQFFIDGKAYGPKHKDVPEWLINWNRDLFVGDYDGSGRWPWIGKLDDARYYKGVLSNREIVSIFSGNTTVGNLGELTP